MHVSFDFWNTLFASNPTFKAERLQLFENCTGASCEYIEDVFRTIGTWHNDRIMLKDGLALSSQSLCSLVFSILDIPLEKHRSLILDMEKLFLEYSPLPINNPTVLEFMDRAVSASILSNTTFIRGSIIRSFLNSKKMKFDFMVFSDEIGCGKPHVQAFNQISLGIDAMKKTEKHREIFHIGDDPKFDASPIAEVKSILL